MGFVYNPMLMIRENRQNAQPKKDPEIKLKSELIFEAVDVLESGMSGGRTSFIFQAIDQETGERYVIQTSAAIIEMLMGVTKGMEERWRSDPVPNIWKS